MADEHHLEPLELPDDVTPEERWAMLAYSSLRTMAHTRSTPRSHRKMLMKICEEAPDRVQAMGGMAVQTAVLLIADEKMVMRAMEERRGE